MKKAFVLMLVFVFAITAEAKFLDGNKLLQLFQSADLVEKGLAYGYVTAIADKTAGTVQCAPPNVTVQQLGDTVQEILLRLPDERNVPADIFVQATLMTMYPCKKEAPPSTSKPQSSKLQPITSV